jgi:hypothetical protein
MAQPLVELKEPLISVEAKKQLHDEFLHSYLKGKYPQSYN